jgi:hypothetical protein
MQTAFQENNTQEDHDAQVIRRIIEMLDMINMETISGEELINYLAFGGLGLSANEIFMVLALAFDTNVNDLMSLITPKLITPKYTVTLDCEAKNYDNNNNDNNDDNNVCAICFNQIHSDANITLHCSH